MRLRWGPHAGRLAEQVVLRDPHYVLTILADHPDGGLAAVLRELIGRFDALPLLCACARCRRPADGVCAYPGSVTLIGFCERCVRRSRLAPPAPALRIGDYEDALRHVVSSFPHGHRVQMRRMVAKLAEAKGGPGRATEAGARTFLTSFERTCLAPPQRPRLRA